MDINIDQIRALAELAAEKNLAEITVEDGDKAVTIKLPSANVVVQAASAPAYTAYPHSAVSAPPAETAPASAPEATPAPASEENYYKVTSPMVGTFYAAPSPDSDPFVKVGATVSKGQTLCIIEAMKLMNELEAEASGKVVKVLVENGQPVEFGQTIMLLDTNG